MADIQNVLTELERSFLTRHGYGPEDVFDGRGMSSRAWKEQAKAEGKNLVLGTACGAAGHRFRTRAGHCAECDPKKLAFQERYTAYQFVYIAGSLARRLIKFGTCRDLDQRENQLRAEGYGGAHDWVILIATMVRNSGAVEDAAKATLSKFAVTGLYLKNDNVQEGKEMLRCSFSTAKDALTAHLDHLSRRRMRVYRATEAYEFENTTA